MGRRNLWVSYRVNLLNCFVHMNFGGLQSVAPNSTDGHVVFLSCFKWSCRAPNCHHTCNYFDPPKAVHQLSQSLHGYPEEIMILVKVSVSIWGSSCSSIFEDFEGTVQYTWSYAVLRNYNTSNNDGGVMITEQHLTNYCIETYPFAQTHIQSNDSFFTVRTACIFTCCIKWKHGNRFVSDEGANFLC